MTDDRSGIDRLRAAVDEVAATLGAPSPRKRGSRRSAVAGSLAAVVLLVAAAFWIARDESHRADESRRLGIEVQELKLRGQEVDVRVFDAAGAGTIVVAPRVGSHARKGE